MLLLFLINVPFTDITIDTKDRVLLLSESPPVIQVLNDSTNIPLDSILYPGAIAAGIFSIWVSSSTQRLIQKYSLKGEYLGSICFRATDIDANRNGLLIAGEHSVFIDLSTGREIPISWRESNLCALGKDSIYLYGNDTLYIYRKPNKLIGKFFIPGIRDITVSDYGLLFLKEDTLVLGDTAIFIPDARRLESSTKKIVVLTDSTVRFYP